MNKKSNYKITVNKDAEELIEINYLRDKDLYGVVFKDILNRYIVVENNNLKEFASKLGIQNTDKIPNKIENIKVSEHLNYEETKSIINKYLNIAIEAIPEDSYSKVEKGDISLGEKTIEADGYQIKLKAKDVQSILIKVLESAKNDEQIFNLVRKISNADITIESYQNSIDELLEEVSDEISKEENINFAYITIYKQEKEAVKLSINFVQEEGVNKEISLNKTNKGLELEYNNKDTSYGSEENIITITKTTNTTEQEVFEFNIVGRSNGEEIGNYNYTLSRTGALTSNNIVFSILMPFDLGNGNINIQFKNTTNFSATPKFDEFNESNHLILNGYTKEQLDDFFAKLGVKILEKLQDEMFVSIISSNNRLFDLASQAQQDMQNAIEEERALTEQMQENLNQIPTINPTTDEITVSE